MSLSRRRVRRLVATMLPAWVKTRVHGPLYGFHTPKVSTRVELSEDDLGPFVLVDNRITLHFNDASRADTLCMFVENGASIEECHGLLALAQSATTLFDVGAATCVYARLFALSGPGKTVVAFEPSPSQIVLSRELIATDRCESLIELCAVAIGASAGRMTGQWFDSGYLIMHAGLAGGAPVDVEVTTLDREVERLHVIPDVIKIDVEGAEHDVLLGGRRLLREHKPIICLELHLGLLEAAGLSPRAVIEELQSHGYRFRTHAGSELRPAQIWDSLQSVLRFVAY